MSKTPFGFKTPEDSPGFLLWQTNTTWQRLIKKPLEQHNISHAQFVIMALLLWFEGQNTEVAQVDIVRMSKLDKMTVSKSLKKSLKIFSSIKEVKDCDIIFITVGTPTKKGQIDLTSVRAVAKEIGLLLSKSQKKHPSFVIISTESIFFIIGFGKRHFGKEMEARLHTAYSL